MWYRFGSIVPNAAGSVHLSVFRLFFTALYASLVCLRNTPYAGGSNCCMGWMSVLLAVILASTIAVVTVVWTYLVLTLCALRNRFEIAVR